MSQLRKILVVLAGFALAMLPVRANELALLVGIGDYRHPAVSDLEGPPHDVQALKLVLREHWGWEDGDIRVLIDEQASRRRILEGLDALFNASKPGDVILFYYSGHGTSRHDPNLGLPLPHGSGALTAWDSTPEGSPNQVVASLIVGRTDLRPRLERLDDGGRKVLVILDACYSANAARGLYRSLTHGRSSANLQTRQMPLTIPAEFNLGAYGYARPKRSLPYPYKNVITLSAASPYEQAADIRASALRQYPTVDNLPHGAFTDGLLRALSGRAPADRNGDGQMSYRELNDTIATYLATNGFMHRPQLQPSSTGHLAQLVNSPLFGSTAPTLAVESLPQTVPDLVVQLDGSARLLAQPLSALQGIVISHQRPGFIVTRKNDEWWIINASGDKVGEAATDAALVSRIEQLLWFHQLSWRKDRTNPFGIALGQTAAERGNINYLGERISFDVRSERDSWLVILYVDANGDIGTLYPRARDEAVPIKGGERVRIPADDSLEVSEPLGTDLVVALAYATRPRFLDRIVGAEVLAPSGVLYQQVMASLRQEGAVAVATLELQTVPAPAEGAWSREQTRIERRTLRGGEE